MKRIVLFVLAFCLVMSTACFAATEEDQAAADHVAELIDAIYVQERTDETDALCAEAKAAWDALTDEQKELVEGEDADPDYFGRDTGDASLDDQRIASLKACGVSAEPDDVRGQIVKASIVLIKGTEGTEELKKEIQQYVKEHTAPYKYPRKIVFRDELPKTISGKIQRNLL